MSSHCSALWVPHLFPTAPLLNHPLHSTTLRPSPAPFPKPHRSLVRWRHFQTGAMMWFGKPLGATPRQCGFCFWGSSWRKCKGGNFIGQRKSPGDSFPSFYFSWHDFFSILCLIRISKDLGFSRYNWFLHFLLLLLHQNCKTHHLFSNHLPASLYALNSEDSHLFLETPALWRSLSLFYSSHISNILSQALLLLTGLIDDDISQSPSDFFPILYIFYVIAGNLISCPPAVTTTIIPDYQVYNLVNSNFTQFPLFYKL